MRQKPIREEVGQNESKKPLQRRNLTAIHGICDVLLGVPLQHIMRSRASLGVLVSRLEVDVDAMMDFPAGPGGVGVPVIISGALVD